MQAWGDATIRGEIPLEEARMKRLLSIVVVYLALVHARSSPLPSAVITGTRCCWWVFIEPRASVPNPSRWVCSQQLNRAVSCLVRSAAPQLHCDDRADKDNQQRNQPPDTANLDCPTFDHALFPSVLHCGSPAPHWFIRGASRYGVRGVAGFDNGSPVLPTMTTEMTAGSVALAFADVL